MISTLEKRMMEEQGKEIDLFTILDIIRDGIMIVDKNYKILYYNRAMEQIEGLRSEEVVGKQFLDVFSFQGYEQSTIMQAIREGRKFDEWIQTYFTSKGRKLTVINSTFPIKTGSEIIGAMEIAKDISSARILTEMVLDLQDKLYKTQMDHQNGKSPKMCRYSFDTIIGESGAIKKAIKIAEKAAGTNSTVLINGETGTGKEMFAQGIHNKSLRRNKPFVAINCAALPGDLLEGILFGTVKGGFTGSIDRPGLFEQANGGTLLLDEIDSMDKSLQAKLLRVIQEERVMRVGGTREIDLNVRLISTSNCDLTEAVERGLLRRDLYYRLSVVNISVPALRERVEDIMVLAQSFMKEYNDLFDKEVKGCTPRVQVLFENYDWPGNVRELRHCIEGIMNLIEREDVIEENMLPPSILNYVKQEKTQVMITESGPLNNLMRDTEKTAIMDALSRTKGNVSGAAKLLGIKRQLLQYRMNKYGISKEEYHISWKEPQ